MKVHKGDLLVDFDIDKIKKAGYDPEVFVIITNTDDYESVLPETYGNVNNDQIIIDTSVKKTATLVTD